MEKEESNPGGQNEREGVVRGEKRNRMPGFETSLSRAFGGDVQQWRD
jgi:hypothetical protein